MIILKTLLHNILYYPRCKFIHRKVGSGSRHYAVKNCFLLLPTASCLLPPASCLLPPASCHLLNRSKHTFFPILLVILLLAFAGKGWGQAYTQSTTTYSWDAPSTNISTTNCDDCRYQVALPFAFTYFGTTYASGALVDVSTNGWLSFTTQTSSYWTNACLPSASAPMNLIAAYWDDLYFYYTCSPTTFRYGTFGTAPNRRFVIAWTAFSATGITSCINYVYTEIKLFETTNQIEVHLQSNALGSSGTIGIENVTGTVGYQAICNTATTNGTAWKWTPCAAPGAPATCSSSINAATPNGVTHYLDLSCAAVTGADGYSYDFSWDNSSWTVNWYQTASNGTLNVNCNDNPNTTVYFRVRAYKCTPQQYSAYTNASPFPIYTACDNPASPTVNTPTATTLNVAITTETPVANPAITTYSIYCVTTGTYVTATGALGAEVYQTKATWGIKTVTGLTCGGNIYTFYAKAKNNDGDVRFNAANTGSGTTSCCSPCTGVPAMSLGTAYTGTLAITCSDWSTYTSCGWSEPGDEIVYSFTPQITGEHTFTLTGTSGDPDFFLMSTCGNGGTNIFGACAGGGTYYATLTKGTTYYLIADNYSAASTAGYSMTVSYDPCRAANVTAMTLTTVYSGTLGTAGAWGGPYTSCTYNEPGAEKVYSYACTSTGNYDVTTTSPAGDPDFFVMSTCGTGGTNIYGACFGSGAVNVSLTSGITYYIIVDNYSSISDAQYTVVIASCAAPVVTLTTPADLSYLATNGSYTNWAWTATGTTPITYNLTIEGTPYNSVTSPQTQLTGSGNPTAASYTWSVYGSNACGNNTANRTYYRKKTITPTTAYQSETFTLPSSNSMFWYEVSMTAGIPYVFATCNHDHGEGLPGGSADFDTWIEVFDNTFTQLVGNDDCGLGGLQSYVKFNCTATGTYYVKARGYTTAFGTYDLRYKYLGCTPTTANAGLDQYGLSMCGLTSTTLQGNTPAVGTGLWTTSGAGGSFGNSASPTSTFSGTAGTTYILRWTISNSPCTPSWDEVSVTFEATPGCATSPSPANSVTGVSTTATLSWSAGTGSTPTSYDVYFGTAASPPFVQNQAGTTYSPAMVASTLYYWKIVPKNSCGTASSCTIWSFTTASCTNLPPASASASPSNICSGSASLTVVGPALGVGASWKWYTVSCGGTLVATGNPVTVSPAVTTTYYVRAEGSCAPTACVNTTVTVGGTPAGVWKGGTSTDWATASNWCSSTVPTSTTDVTIPSGTTYQPTITCATIANCRDLVINPGATLTVDAQTCCGFLCLGGNGFLQFSGNLTNNGTINHTGNAWIYTGGVGKTIGGTGTFTNTGINFYSGWSTTLANDITIQQIRVENSPADGTLNLGPYMLTINYAIQQYGILNLNTGTFRDKALFNQNFTPSKLNHNTGTFWWDISGTGSIGSFNLVDNDYYSLRATTDNTYTMSLATMAALNLAGNLTIDPNTIFSANNIPINIKGNWTNNGTFTPTSVAVTFNGNINQSIGGSSNTSFYNLTINNTGASGNDKVTLNKPVTVTNALALTDGVIASDATNLLSLTATASSTLGVAGSFVDGPIKKTGSTLFTFPTGDIQGSTYVWAPIEIAAPGVGTDAFTAQYNFLPSTNNDASHMSTSNGGLDHVSKIEYWTLNRDAGSSAPTVKLYWKDGTRSGITDISTGAGQDLFVAHYEDVTEHKWQNMGGSISGTLASGSITSTVAFPNYSPVTFGSKTGTNLLPVELLSFNAICKNTIVNLNWQTASETNNDYFTIERTKDLHLWDFVANVDGAGNSNSPLTYTTYDLSPYTGTSYYRLLQTDFDGKSETFDPPASVNCDEEAPFYTFDIVNIQTNEAQNELEITYTSPMDGEAVSACLFNTIGQQLIQQKQTASKGYNTIKFSHYSLVRGIYMVTLDNQEKVITQKIIIN